ncbi:ATP-binding protein [Kitasatospora purpeofusca]|uniref:ATP-binding protein n=1 Tax=Kitasatospora purpeofusca TaxID=67352 RepID=UPI00224F079D|nr:regulator [Kitasatospora purpeofusca]MCX4758194.1 regulator [Kitasatospora purpeofusca]WSR31342.1 regulator [Kitasatospora purpeofusca]WSR39366.1 regulator [Kitasatospora purpeofusca]
MDRDSTPRPDGPGPGRLPAEVTSFVGRQRELTELSLLLAERRLVTVTGPGGVGKSRLALRAAARAAGAFPDGTWLVEAAPVQDGRLLGHAVLEALRLTDGTARPPLEVLTERLAGRRLLLVLDGCEHLVPACAELALALLRALPGLRVLATSRVALRTAGEHLLNLAPLPVGTAGAIAAGAPPDAVLLFADRARAVLPSFAVTAANAEGIAQLCRRLDGIPLAVELAAGRLRALSVEQIGARLDDRFRLLTGGDPAALPRHQTLRTTIGWSHELCTEQERLLWARLSVFAGVFDLDAAEYVCGGEGVDPDELLDLLTELVAKSVVLREDSPFGVRFRLLDTVREYGLRWLRAAGEEHRLLCRHRDWYLGVATWGEVEWFGPRQAETAERTGLAHANLRAALEFCLAEPGEEQIALLMAGTLWFFWVGCGHLGEGRHWLDRALALAPEPTEARAKALWVTGYMATLQGDLVSARPALEECRRQALATGDDRALAYAVHRQGCAALIGDEPARAAELFEEALWHYRTIGELNSNVLMAMFELGIAYLFQGDQDSGELWLGQVRELCEEHGEQWAYAYALYALAYSQWLNGEVRPARALARESVRLNHLFNDLLGIVLAIDLLALLETEPAGPGEPGDLREARVLQGAAHRIWQAVGKPFFGSRTFNGPHRACEERAGAGLTEQEYTDFFTTGTRLDLDAAVHRALGGGEHPGDPGARPGPGPLPPAPQPSPVGR